MKIFKKVGIALVMMIALGFSGCGDSNTQNENNPSVEYGGDTEGDNDISKYTNADWLYQNYFGEYGFPNELKQMMLPELQMIANGFAMQYAKGEDVQKSILHLNTAMTTSYYSGKLNSMAQSMQEGYQEGLYNVHDVNQTVLNHKKTTRKITTETQKNINESIKRKKQYKKEQEELVKKYNLPYSIPNKVTKTIIYSPAMKDSGGKSGLVDKVNKYSHDTKFSGLDKWDWSNADFFWTNGTGGIGHMGLIDASDRNGFCVVIDSMPGVGVQSHYGLTDYANKSGNSDWTTIEGYEYTAWSPSDSKRNDVLQFAYSRVGKTSYSLLVSKNNRNKSYCSSFIWQAFYDSGVNLDSDGGFFVWPRDITNHSSVMMFNSQNR
ncbi:MAG: hypothetical protein LGB54_05000 [Sulfurovum sp.]|nr:hypothetical protein [Sulfurovum sp.]